MLRGYDGCSPQRRSTERGLPGRNRPLPGGSPDGAADRGRQPAQLPHPRTPRPHLRTPRTAGAPAARGAGHRRATGGQRPVCGGCRARDRCDRLPRRTRPQLERRPLLRPARPARPGRRRLHRRPAGPPGGRAVPRSPALVRQRHVERRDAEPPAGLRAGRSHRRHCPGLGHRHDQQLHPAAPATSDADSWYPGPARPLGRRQRLRHCRRPDDAACPPR